MPTVLPSSSYSRVSAKSPTRHLPAVTLLCCQWSFFIVARISIIACSATATELAPPLLATGTPALRAAARSTVL